MTLVGLEYAKNQENARHNRATEQSAHLDRVSREGIAAMDRQSKESIASLDRASKENIASKDRRSKENVSSADRVAKTQIATMQDDTTRDVARAKGFTDIWGNTIKSLGRILGSLI